jgi:hypothetical protein
VDTDTAVTADLIVHEIRIKETRPTVDAPRTGLQMSLSTEGRTQSVRLSPAALEHEVSIREDVPQLDAVGT